MEKYSKYRDAGSGIAPFFPIPSSPSGVYLPLHILLFVIRVPLLVTMILFYVALFSWLPVGGRVGSILRKAMLWCILAVPGIWWIDLQIDGVKRGTLSKSHTHLPSPGSLLIPTTTSPLDTLYLAAVFDPLFIRTYPTTRAIHTQSFLSALLFPLSPSSLLLAPPPNTQTTTLPRLLGQAKHRDRILLLPAECTPTNSRAILPLSPALATVPRHTKIFPTSLRYNPPDVTTPVPGWRGTWRFLWCLCGRGWTHTVRVRIAAPVRNESDEAVGLKQKGVDIEEEEEREDDAPLSATEKMLLSRVGETLARLGRVKRVALGVREKGDFVRLWRRRGRG